MLLSSKKLFIVNSEKTHAVKIYSLSESEHIIQHNALKITDIKRSSFFRQAMQVKLH